MNDLSRFFAPDDTRDAIRNLGGLLIGLGLFMTFARKSGDNLGAGWGDWGLLVTLLIAFVFLYGVGLLGRWNTPALRPWQSVYTVFGIFLAPFVLFQFIEAINGTPGASLNVFWVFLVTSGLAVVASLVVGVRYGLLLAAVALIVSWSALWNKILSDGLSAHYGIYRGLLLILAVLLLGAALGIFLADRDGRLGDLGGTDADRDLAHSRANEIVTGAAIAAVVAGALSFTRVFETPFVDVPTADSSLFWELVLLVVSLLAVGYGSRFGTRGTTYVGAIGLFVFLLIAGLDLNDSTPQGKIVGWPLALVIVGAVAFVASLVPNLRLPSPQVEGPGGPGGGAPGSGPGDTAPAVPPPGGPTETGG